MTAPHAQTPQHAAVEHNARLPQSVERPFDEHHCNDHSATSDHQNALLTILPRGQVHDAVAGILDEANIEDIFADISTGVGVQNLVDEITFTEFACNMKRAIADGRMFAFLGMHPGIQDQAKARGS